MRYYLTGDEHFFHDNGKGKSIIKYSNRPFKDLAEMHDCLISNHNERVTPHDMVIHHGDFSYGNELETEKIIQKLNGNHLFLRGCHDYWADKKRIQYIYKLKLGKGTDKKMIICCHCPFESWNGSFHENSFHTHAHVHGRILNNIRRRYDVGVDANNFYPISVEELFEIWKNQSTLKMSSPL